MSENEFFLDLCRCSMWTLNWILYELIWKQECIPVGCVPSAAVTVGGGVCFPGGVLSDRAVCFLGVYFLGEGVCFPGVLSGGCASRAGGGCLPLGYVYTSMHWGRHTTPPPHVDRILETRLWKYYPVATSLRTVTMSLSLQCKRTLKTSK